MAGGRAPLCIADSPGQPRGKSLGASRIFLQLVHAFESGLAICAGWFEQHVARRRQRVVIDVAVDPERHRWVMSQPFGRRRH